MATKGRGEKSWSEPLMLGLPDAVYIEDCTFDGVLYVTDAFHGARFVFRQNSVSRGAVANHGLDSGGYRSTFSMEIFRRLKLPLEQHTFAVSAFDAARNESQESGPVKTAQ